MIQTDYPARPNYPLLVGGNIQGARIQFQGAANQTPVLFEGFASRGGRPFRGLGQFDKTWTVDENGNVVLLGDHTFKCTSSICFGTNPMTHAAFKVTQRMLNRLSDALAFVGLPKLKDDGLIGRNTVTRAQLALEAMGRPSTNLSHGDVANLIAKQRFLNDLRVKLQELTGKRLNTAQEVQTEANKSVPKTVTVQVSGEPQIDLPKDALANLAKNLAPGEAPPEIEAAAQTAAEQERSARRLAIGAGVAVAGALAIAGWLIWRR